VKKVDEACLDGRRFAVAAKKFILAAGGIENARILLVSRKVQKAGLGNDRDLVGRFFMEHPFLKSAQFLPANPYGVGLYKSSKVAPKVGSLGSTQAETLIKGCLKLSPDALRREQLLNFRATLEPTYADGLASLDHIVGTMAGGDLPDDFLSHLGNVIRDIDHIVHAGYGRLTRGTYPVRLLEVFSCIEQAPNPDSRVMLSTECDGLGMPRVKLQWALTPIDRTTIRRANDILAEEMGRGGEGRLKITLQEDNWPQAHDVGFHHMGTTRMHPNPQSGVVDANCLVHGLSNLYIAGSSVFPTCGSANPTLTIVALAIRLASHLQEHLS
jgi:choline dehydrogenase-like flavoprotein